MSVKKWFGFAPEIRRAIYLRDKGLCVNCGEKATDIHHLIPNTELSRGRYTNERIQSILNGVCVCHRCHEKHSLWDRPIVKYLIHLWAKFQQSKTRREG